MQVVPPLRLVFWITSALGVALGLLALGGRAQPWTLCLAGLLVHAGIATAGVLLPSLGVFASVLSRGPSARNEVALTFDDGPHPATTPRVLATLAEYGAPATFFVLGTKAERYPELVRDIARAGHCVGVHGYTHAWAYSLWPGRVVARDLERAVRAIEGACGVRPTLFRPPIGFVGPGVVRGAERAGLTLVGFSARTGDGLGSATPEAVLERATSALEPGAILVLHDAAEQDDHVPASAPVLGELLARLDARGLVPVSVDALRRPI